MRDLARLTFRWLIVLYNTVAFFIFNHGIPDLFNAPFKNNEDAVTKAERLVNMLEDAMRWHASLLLSIVEHEGDQNMKQARQLASLDQGAWRRQRQEAKRQAWEKLSHGRRLATERDCKKRKYEDMSATEQQALKDFDTNAAHKNYDAACVKKMPRFSGVLYNAT